MPSKNRKYLSFDVGGTKISSAIVEIGKSGYEIVDYQKTETPEGRDNVINNIIETAVNFEKKGGFTELRIAIAAQVDCEKDIVRYAPNIPGFENVNLKKVIKEKIGKNVEVDNDVKCFALAENAYGKGKEYDHVVYLTIGTGIGGAIEINNKLYRGANNTAGEFGHMVIVYGGEKCSCGGNGCWERYVSGRAIERIYHGQTGTRKKAVDIAADSAKGIAEDKKVIKEASLYLAAGLINIVNTVNPELIVIGGSIVKSREIFDLAIEELKDRALIPAKKTKIKTTDLDDYAFLVGAALL
ncbi:MAG: ROK family protein [Candidatus Paceibacterota bacterium]|jgi:glucokinase